MDIYKLNKYLNLFCGKIFKPFGFGCALADTYKNAALCKI